MALTQARSCSVILLLVLFPSCGGSISGSPSAIEQGHVFVQRPATSEAVKGWFVWSYYGVDHIESEVTGLGERFSSTGWLGIQLEDGAAHALYVEALPGRELQACLDYHAAGLLRGDTITPEHLRTFAQAKCKRAESSELWADDATEFLQSSWRTITAEGLMIQDPTDDWITKSIEAYSVVGPIQQSVIYDDWRGRPPLSVQPWR